MNRSDLPELCPSCGEACQWLWRRFTNRGGHITFPYCCSECGHKSNIMEKKAVVIQYLKNYGHVIDDIPELPKTDQPCCDVCGNVGAELHHYAPQHLFDDAHIWPTGYLCVYHHRMWHDRIRRHA